MRLNAYLSSSRHGMFYFRWPVPSSPDHPKLTTVRLSLRSFITYATLDDLLPQIMEEVASDFMRCSIPTKRTYLSEYAGPTGLVMDDIEDLLTELGTSSQFG